MSIAIKQEYVAAILLGNEWVRIDPDTFVMDAGGVEVFKDHVVEEELWFRCTDVAGWEITGPYASIQAFRLVSQ